MPALSPPNGPSKVDAIASSRAGIRLEQRLPQVMASPPTFGAASTTSSFGTTTISAMEAGAFTYLGGPAWRGGVPNDGGNFPNYEAMLLGSYAGTTSPSPCAIDFELFSNDSTGRFELYFIGNGARVRVMVQNQAGVWEKGTAASTWILANDGLNYYLPVTMGAAGRYHIRVEVGGGARFRGIRVYGNDTVQRGATPRRRYIVVGDSYTEPTIVDSGSSHPSDGWVQQLSYLTGFDLWSAGSGGTSYVNPNSAASRQKYRDRLASVITPFAPDGIIFAGGLNDQNFTTAAAVGVEAAACFDEARILAPNADIIALSPFFPRAVTVSSDNILAIRDSIQSAAVARGLKFLDLLSLPIPEYLGTWSSTLGEATLAGAATSIKLPTLPAYFSYSNPGQDNFYVYVEDGSAGEMRKVVSITPGSPNNTVGLSFSLSNAHAAGRPVYLAGPGYITGAGKQGATTGSGNADLFTGNDGSHPTVAGHAHHSITVHHLWARAVANQ